MHRAFLLVTLWSLFVCSSVWAQKNNKEAQDDAKVRAAEQARANAQKDVAEAQRKLADATKDLQQAQSKQAAVAAEAKKIRESAEARLASSSGLDKAVADVDQAKASFTQKSTPILERLRATPAYLAAAKAAEEAKTQVRDAALLPPTQRDAKLKIIQQASGEPNRMERAAVDGDSAAKTAYDQYMAAQQRAAAVREQLRKQVESDPDVKRVIDKAEAAVADVRKAEATVNQRKADVGRQQTEARQAEAKVAAAKAADRANDNQPKKPQPKKK